MNTPISQALLKFAGKLRFPKLLALTAVLFVANVFIPDLLPFADEIFLGLVAMLLSSLKKRKDPDSNGEPSGDDPAPPPALN